MAPGPITDVARVSGGGAESAEASATNEVNAQPPVGIHEFQASSADTSANPYTQAGGHPYELTTEVNFATKTLLNDEGGWGLSGITPVRDPKEASVDLPPG